mmetsp:Transcript_55032/g.170500  ORF Transcript_55032/g.170500 Transcript_55032/m.170500 type:complete len:262 (-) Transcript_55032:47-832(-)
MDKSGIDGAFTTGVDSVVDNFDFGRYTGCVKYLALFSVVLLLSVQPLITFFEIRRNVHIEFWLGPLPIWLNLAVPISLCNMFLIFLCLKGRHSKGCIKGTLLCWFTTNGVALIVYGLYCVIHSIVVRNELLADCGTGDSLSTRIQAEWDRLEKFLKDCQKQEDWKDIFIQQCPGFSSVQAPPHDLYVTYIEEMESDYNCHGFCKIHDKPLISTETYEGSGNCAKAVGRHILEVGLEVGLPMITIGVLVMMLGVCLSSYRHL